VSRLTTDRREIRVFNRMKRLHFAALLALGARAAAAQPAAGPEFLVDSYTTGVHGSPAVAADGHGNFVAVWQRDGAIFGQRFTAAGARRGAEFEVSPSGGLPSVAASGGGAFMVAWHDAAGASGMEVQARRFDASGAPAGGVVAVNTYTTGTQARPAVAADGAGNFVVVWQSAGQDGPGYSVIGRRFDAAGAPLGGEFQVSPALAANFGDQTQPAVDAHASGSFVVAWHSRVAFFGPETRAVALRRFDAAGAPLGDPFEATVGTSARPGGPDLALDGAGNFVVTWSHTFGGFPLPGSTVFARRFDAAGVALSGEFGVPASTTFSQGSPSIGMDRAGNFTIAWVSRAQEGEQFFHGVYAQRFDSGGGLVGGEFRVNTYTPGDQRSPAIVSGPDENFTVLWDGPRSGMATLQVLGQRYGDVIFRDGFAAEGLGRWSAVAHDGGDLRVSAAAALDGSPTGLEAEVDDTASLFVQDETPTAEPLYRALFHFDPNGFDTGEAQNHARTRLFIGFDAAARRAFALVLRRRNGEYALMARARLSAGGRVDTPFVPITDAPHSVELLYAAETAPEADDGVLILAVDNVTVAVLEDLDLAAPIERARLGALSVKGGAAGSLLFDGFDSRRSP
jgi:hypothetical protein